MKIPVLYDIERCFRRLKLFIKDRTNKVRREQEFLFNKNFKDTKKMIVFVNFPNNEFCGGTMTLFYFAKASREMKDIHGCEVIHANFFNHEGKYYIRQDRFKNDEIIYNMELVMKKAKNLDKLILHVPELLMEKLAKELEKYKDVLKKIPDFQINILNQNDEIFPPPEKWVSLRDITDNITQTTGFDKYTRQDICDYYQIPMYRLIGYNGLHEAYEKTDFSQKEKLIIYSPDVHPKKNEILETIKNNLPEFELKEIFGITFDEYMQILQRAMFAITFGEGFDGYYTTIHFVGGLGFSVYNKVFFPSVEYKNFKTVYESYDELQKKIVDDMKYFMEHPQEYKELSLQEEALNIKTTYNKQLTNSLLEKFYKKEPTFVPQKCPNMKHPFEKVRVTYSEAVSK